MLVRYLRFQRLLRIAQFNHFCLRELIEYPLANRICNICKLFVYIGFLTIEYFEFFRFLYIGIVNFHRFSRHFPNKVIVLQCPYNSVIYRFFNYFFSNGFRRAVLRALFLCGAFVIGINFARLTCSAFSDHKFSAFRTNKFAA